LDGDLYESTKICLEYLFPKIVKGGYLAIDDYALTGCRLAVTEYLEKQNIKLTFTPIEGGGGPVWTQLI
jgi:O-methyltransferase